MASAKTLTSIQTFFDSSCINTFKGRTQKGLDIALILSRVTPPTKAPPNLSYTSSTSCRMSQSRRLLIIGMTSRRTRHSALNRNEEEETTRRDYRQRCLLFFLKEIHTDIPSMEIHLSISLCAGDLASSLKWITMHILSVRV